MWTVKRPINELNTMKLSSLFEESDRIKKLFCNGMDCFLNVIFIKWTLFSCTSWCFIKVHTDVGTTSWCCGVECDIIKLFLFLYPLWVDHIFSDSSYILFLPFFQEYTNTNLAGRLAKFLTMQLNNKNTHSLHYTYFTEM